jgi:hypothetical protein
MMPDDAATPHDPLSDAFSAVQFGDSSNAEDIAKLRTAIRSEAMAEIRDQRHRGELARSQATVQRMFAENPDIVEGTPAAAAVEGHVFALLQEDLARHGITKESFRQQFGRDPSPAEIAKLHWSFRADHPGSVRSAEQFLSEALDQYRNRPGGYVDGRENNGAARSYTPAVRTRVNEARTSRGEAKLDADYGTAAPPGADPEAAKASRTVQQMQAQRRAARQTSSIPTVTVRRAG